MSHCYEYILEWQQTTLTHTHLSLASGRSPVNVHLSDKSYKSNLSMGILDFGVLVATTIA